MFQPHHSSLPSKPIAWALLSQTVWLPLIAIDLHDRWQDELHDQQQIAVAASGSSNSSILQTKSNQANTLGAASPGSGQTIGPERSSRATHTGLLLGSSSRTLQGLDGHSESYTEAGSTPANPSDSRHLPRSQARSTWVGTATDHATPLVNQRSGRSSSTVESHTQAELTRSSSSDESIPSYGFDSGWRSRYNRAELLGGSLSIHDPNGAAAMPPLAMAERARWSSTSDPLAPLPTLWREPMRKAIYNLSASRNELPRITGARVIHVPSLRVQQSTPVPVAVQRDGSVDILSAPSNTAVVDEIRQWSARQSVSAANGMTAAVVQLEPIPESVPVVRPAVLHRADSASDPDPNRGTTSMARPRVSATRLAAPSTNEPNGTFTPLRSPAHHSSASAIAPAAMPPLAATNPPVAPHSSAHEVSIPATPPLASITPSAVPAGPTTPAEVTRPGAQPPAPSGGTQP